MGVYSLLQPYSVGSFYKMYGRQRYSIHGFFDESFHARPFFSSRSLLSRTRRNLLINKTKLRFFRCLCVCVRVCACVCRLFFPHARFFQSKLSPRLSVLGRRPLRPLWLPPKSPPRFLLLRRPLEEFQLWSCVSGACLLRAAFCHRFLSLLPAWCYSW